MAASKVSIAKDSQGYRKELSKCGNCKFFTSERTVNKAQFAWSNDWVTEKNKRCTIGGFAVQSSAVCDLWEKK